MDRKDGVFHGPKILDFLQNYEKNLLNLLVNELLRTIGFFGQAMTLCFTRRNFGERFYPIERIIITFIGLLFLSLFDNSLKYFAVLWLIVSLFHVLIIHYRNSRGDHFYSFSRGDPYISYIRAASPNSWFFKDWIIRAYIEPFIVFGIGVLINKFHPNLGFLTMGSAVINMVTELHDIRQSRHRLLDMRDQQIVSRHFENALVHQKPMSETQGFTIPAPRYMKKRERQNIANALKGLDPKLQELMGHAAPVPAPQPQALAQRRVVTQRRPQQQSRPAQQVPQPRPKPEPEAEELGVEEALAFLNNAKKPTQSPPRPKQTPVVQEVEEIQDVEQIPILKNPVRKEPQNLGEPAQPNKNGSEQKNSG